MNTTSTNRRVKYTRMALKDSFIHILSKKEISKITVKEICERADINRTTFYLHFKDPYDLLEQIENEFIQDIDAYLASCDFNQPYEFPIYELEKILDYIKINQDLTKILLCRNNGSIFQQQIMDIIGHQHFFSKENAIFSFHPQGDYMFSFFASGAIGIIKKWLDENTVLSSKTIAIYIVNAAAYGSSSLEKEHETLFETKKR